MFQTTNQSVRGVMFASQVSLRLLRLRTMNDMIQHSDALSAELNMPDKTIELRWNWRPFHETSLQSSLQSQTARRWLSLHHLQKPTSTTWVFRKYLGTLMFLDESCNLVCFRGCNSEVTQTKPRTSWQRPPTIRSNLLFERPSSAAGVRTWHTYTQNVPCTQVTLNHLRHCNQILVTCWWRSKPHGAYVQPPNLGRAQGLNLKA